MKKLLINLICAMFPFSKTRKKVRTSLIEKLYKKEVVYITPKSQNSDNKQEIEGIDIDADCDNYKIIIHKPCRFSNCHFSMKKNSVIEIFESKHLIKNLYIGTGVDSVIKIDKDFSCSGCFIECYDEKGFGVNIGSDCMFAHGIKIRTSDGHSIYDINTKAILNKPKRSINIGNHVWIGMNTGILKEVSLPDNVIVAAGAMVTSSFDKSNVIIGGVPAKVIKENVNWSRKNTDHYKNNVYKEE